MDEISHMNFPDIGDFWTINELPVLVVVGTTDTGVTVCTQKIQSDTLEWDLSYVKDLSLAEFRQKLTHARSSDKAPLAKVHPGAYTAYIKAAV